MLAAGRYQRQVGQARLLGEAYNYRLLPSRVVIDTLHLFLAAGHADPAEAARLDPPTSYFRIRYAPLFESMSQIQFELFSAVLDLYGQLTFPASAF